MYIRYWCFQYNDYTPSIENSDVNERSIYLASYRTYLNLVLQKNILCTMYNTQYAELKFEWQ